MKKIIFFLPLLVSVIVHSQQLLSDVAGRPIMLQPYENIKGSAYLYEDWKKGNVTDKYGTTFLDVQLRFDVYANKLFFLHKDTPYEFVTDIRSFELYPFDGDTLRKLSFKKGLQVDGRMTAAKYAEVLAEGKLVLVKYHQRSMDEISEYNVTGKVKTFTPRSDLFLFRGDSAVAQKISQKLLEEIMGDRWEGVKAFVSQNSLGYKKDTDLARIIIYYNSL